MDTVCRKCGNKIIIDVDNNLEIEINSGGGYDYYSQFVVCPCCGERNWMGTSQVKQDSYYIEVE